MSVFSCLVIMKKKLPYTWLMNLYYSTFWVHSSLKIEGIIICKTLKC